MTDDTSRPCRVWIFNHYATPPDRAGGTRHYWIGRAIIARRGEVTIFATGFGHASGRNDRVGGRALVRNETFDGVRFVWLRSFPYRGNSWRRIVNMASYAVMVTLAQIGRPRPDVVVGSSVHPLAALAGWFVARLRGARFVYEVRDLWPQTMIDIGAMGEHSPTAKILYAIEAFLARRAESIVTVLPGMTAYLASRGLPTAHVHYLPNGADLSVAGGSDGDRDGFATGVDALAPVLAELTERRERGEVVFAWTGAHGLVNGLDIAIRAMSIASGEGGPPMSLILVGDGPEKPALKRLASELGAGNVLFIDPIRKDRIPELLAHVDVGVLHATATPVHRYGVSFNKLFDYMAAGLPIAFACDTFADPVAAAGAGLTIPPDDPEALAAGFLALASASATERRRMGDAGRALVEREHDLAKIGSAFADLLGCEREARSDSGPIRS